MPAGPTSLARQLCHWGPIVALTLIAVVIISGHYCSIQLYGLPTAPYFKKINMILVPAQSIWLLYVYYRALGGPGFVPLKWKPSDEKDMKYLQYCHICEGYKAPRSHHCKTCGRCVKKLDHHCPWINTCVGHHNHTSFMAFLVFLLIGCVYAVVVNGNFLHRLFSYDFLHYPKTLPINTFTIIFAMMGIAFSTGAFLGVTLLFCVQIKYIIKNKSQIEEWICEKAQYRRTNSKDLKPFVYPYDLGTITNIRQVIRCSFKPLGDGFTWPVKDGCTQYTLTIEQLEQKEDKRKRGVLCGVTQDFNGSRWSTRPMDCLCSPCMEPLIPVIEGDQMLITRWRQKWVYGNKENIQDDEVKKGIVIRGWIPRKSILKEDTCHVNKIGCYGGNEKDKIDNGSSTKNPKNESNQIKKRKKTKN
jgi:palmitoyltransferase